MGYLATTLGIVARALFMEQDDFARFVLANLGNETAWIRTQLSDFTLPYPPLTYDQHT